MLWNTFIIFKITFTIMHKAHAHTFVIVDVVVHKNVHEDSTEDPRVN